MKTENFINQNDLFEILDETFEAFPECDLFYIVLENKIREMKVIQMLIFDGENYEKD